MLFERGFGWYFRACPQCGLASAAPQLQPRFVRLAIISKGVNTWPLCVAKEYMDLGYLRNAMQQ